MRKLENKSVVISGGGKDESVGYGIARACARAGANLALVGRSKRRLAGARELEKEYGVRVLPLCVGSASKQDVESVVSQIAGEFGCLDVLVNAALFTKVDFLKSLTAEDLEASLQTCVIEPFVWMRAAYPHLKDAQGCVINFVSESASQALPALGALAASSEGLRALSAVAATEWEQDGIDVICTSAQARTSQYEKLCREHTDDSNMVIDEESLASVDEIGEACVDVIVSALARHAVQSKRH